jgi:serine/tyrosine/threonine adenylyltransferase
VKRLEGLAFDNSYARLGAPLAEAVAPTPLPAPRLVSFNAAAAALLDLDAAEAARPEFAEYFAGNRLLPGSEPVAMRYAGHQFGSWVPQLGDGRAILLGEVINSAGERWDLHLKGGGPTPFSRGFDGRAVLRSTIREYLCGEAMHALGIPSTRSLCIVGSDAPVYRETAESAATLVRLAPSHVRFGSFEIFAYRKQDAELARLADYVIGLHFPHLAGRADRYAAMLREATVRTAQLIAGWQAVGFVHGVMNTDNMSVLGLTLDYGPYGFVEAYDSAWVCNHSDPEGRYALDQQPGIGEWNCAALAQALLPLVPREEAVAALDCYAPAFEEAYGRLMRAKLGLAESRAEDAALVGDLLGLMQAGRVDYTIAFRTLCRFRVDQEGGEAAALFADRSGFAAWSERYRTRLRAEGSDDSERARRMQRVNPKYILRSYLAQNAIGLAERGDYTEVDRLLALLQQPFDEQPEMEHYAAAPPEWARGLVLSCSS